MANAPVFIIGTGRCGSTILHDIMATHPGLTYLSKLCNKYPARPQRNAQLMRLLDLGVAEHRLRHRYNPAEVYRFWDYYAPGFSQPCRDLMATDVTDRIRRRLSEALTATMSQSRPLLLVKVTGWPRIGFLREIFPSARFIHVYRDGRAVANSLLNVQFWDGWRGPARWRWGPLSELEQEKWNRHAQSFVTLAGLQWAKLMEAFRAARDFVPSDQLLELPYEELCNAPRNSIQRSLDFAGISRNAKFDRRVASFNLVDQNAKWRRDLNAAQQVILEDSMRDELGRWGYQ